MCVRIGRGISHTIFHTHYLHCQKNNNKCSLKKNIAKKALMLLKQQTQYKKYMRYARERERERERERDYKGIKDKQKLSRTAQINPKAY